MVWNALMTNYACHLVFIERFGGGLIRKWKPIKPSNLSTFHLIHHSVPLNPCRCPMRPWVSKKGGGNSPNIQLLLALKIRSGARELNLAMHFHSVSFRASWNFKGEYCYICTLLSTAISTIRYCCTPIRSSITYYATCSKNSCKLVSCLINMPMSNLILRHKK